MEPARSPQVSNDVQSPPPPQANRDEAFRQIFEQSFDYVWTSLRRLGVPERDRDDLTTEVFLRVHRRIDDRDPDRPLKPWLFAFAVRIAADYRRLSRHRVEVFDDSSRGAAHGHDTPPDELLLRREKESFLLQLLECLDQEKRAIFILHELEEESVPAAAAVLGIPTATAYSRLRAARIEVMQAAERRKAQRP